MIGAMLGPYEILEKIGEGGMGEVYRARDRRLDRDVAVKILPESFANDSDRLARFSREAKTLAALNHPNIGAIYGLEDANGVSAIVMELVEGEDLADRLRRGAIPLDEALLIARQIAEALEAAHAQGIVHRDLKPANIKMRGDGTVKVLDFGLAKALDPDAASQGPSDLSRSPTITTPAATRVGMIIGTAGYMSPEQARGQTITAQTDIWAFGVVLYEMLTGKQAFTGETITDVLAGIVRADPDWTVLPDTVPAPLRLLLRRCLHKKRSARLHHIADARIEIEGILADPSPVASGAPAPVSVRRRALQWIVAAGLLLIGGATALVIERYVRPEPGNPGLIRFFVSPPVQTSFAGGPNAPYVSLSPDGRYLAFVADLEGVARIWVRPLDTPVARSLAGTEEVVRYPPFWSPDSRSIGFVTTAGKLRKIEMAGGPAQTLCDAPITGNPSGTWNRDGVIVFGGGTGPLQRVSAAGGAPEPVTTLDQSRQEVVHTWPTFLPDGDRYLFLARSATREHSAIFAGSLSSRETKLVVTADSRIAYDPSGYVLFVREQSLMALPFDAKSSRQAGDAVVVAEQVRANTEGQASLTVSQNGVLAYRTGEVQGSALTWFDRSGKTLGTVGSVGAYDFPELSPDDRRVAISRPDSRTQLRNVWVADIARGLMSRTTFGTDGLGLGAVWSPDGERIAFQSVSGETIYVKQSSGAGNEDPLFKFPGGVQDWSADGRFIVSNDRGAITILPLFGDRKPMPYLPQEKFRRGQAQLSADGRWLAYWSDESGRREIYVQSFPDPASRWQASTDGGDSPRWRRDGKELFYLAADDKLMVVAVTASANTMELSKPVSLFEIAVGAVPRHQYDVTGDGQRFLVNSIANVSGTPVTVVINWTAGLKR